MQSSPIFFFPYVESIVKHRAGLLCVDRRHPRWPHAIQLEALMALCVCVGFTDHLSGFSLSRNALGYAVQLMSRFAVSGRKIRNRVLG